MCAALRVNRPPPAPCAHAGGPPQRARLCQPLVSGALQRRCREETSQVGECNPAALVRPCAPPAAPPGASGECACVGGLVAACAVCRVGGRRRPAASRGWEKWWNVVTAAQQSKHKRTCYSGSEQLPKLGGSARSRGAAAAGAARTRRAAALRTARGASAFHKGAGTPGSKAKRG